ncbi:MAG: hypothetical protein SGBAC_011599 [Bacillariaceae sp.]
MWRNFCRLLACFLVLLNNRNIQITAFAPSPRTKLTSSSSGSNTNLNIFKEWDKRGLASLEQSTPGDQEVSKMMDTYSEKSRLYRRNVFSAADWVRVRRSDRFMNNIKTTFQSGLIRQLAPELSAILSVSVLVVLYNDVLAVGYLDFGGIQHKGIMPFLPPLELPIVAWSISTSALGLLLAFRTSVCYARWNEARTAWGKVINDSRSIVRMGCIWSKSYKSINNEGLQRLGDAVCSFSRSLMNRTLPQQEDEANFVMYTYNKIQDRNYGNVLRTAKHRPTAALAEISNILVDFQLNPLHQVEVEKVVTGLCDALGASERIFTSPVPRFYSHHTTRFLAFWLLTLPIGMYEPLKDTWNHWAVVPMTLILASMLLGIEELANQMEEPFSILPMEKMCEGSIRTGVMEQVERSQLGMQAEFCGYEDEGAFDLMDANPENIRAIAPASPHWLGGANGEGATNANGESFQVNGNSEAAKEEELPKASPEPEIKASNPTPTFQEYMASRNIQRVDTTL